MLPLRSRLPAAHRTLLSRVACAALLALCAPGAGSARAAHLTDVADAMDERHPVEVDLDFGYLHLKKQTKVTRENVQLDPATQKRGIVLVDELQHTETTDQLDFRLNVGLYHDLELHIIAPLLIGQKQEWGFATVNGASVQPVSTLQNNKINISGCNATGACDAANPLLPTPGQSLRAGFKDPTIGLAWGPINEEREQLLKPDLFPQGHAVSTWVLGLDYTLPLPGDVDDPSKYLVPATSTAPVAMAANAGTVSHPAIRKAHVFSPWTAFSKRFKVLDPYFGVRAKLPIPVGGSSAGDGSYDNCWHREQLADVASPSGTFLGNCAAAAWKGDTGYKPAYTGAFTFGTELIVVDDKVAQQKVAFDLHTEVTWFSPSRGYSQVADALGKLTYEEEHVQALTTLGFYGRIARWLHVRVSGTLGVDTPHFLTSESIGKDLDGDGQVQISAGATGKSPEQNPTYDFRVDQPGRRLRAEAVFIWGVSGALALNF
jgi:hypothetical protein